jgi:hypothetical protein
LKTSQPPRNIPPGFTAEQAATFEGLELQTKSFEAAAVCNFEEKVSEQMRTAGNLGDRPLIVLTAGQPFRVGDPEADKELAAFHEIWAHQLQPQLARLSTRGQQVIVENSGHVIDPNAILKAIQEMTMEIRRK